MINSSVIAPYMKTISWELFSIISVVFLLAVSGYVLCLVLGHYLWKDSSIITMFVFTGGMRNIAVGVVIATTYFPAKTVMPVVFGMLFQQVLASFFSRVMERYQLKYGGTKCKKTLAIPRRVANINADAYFLCRTYKEIIVLMRSY